MRGPLFQLHPETVEKEAMSMMRQASRLEAHFEQVRSVLLAQNSWTVLSRQC